MVTNRNVVIVGFMGTGKTEVGRIVSEQMGRTFVDIDDQIVSAAGMTINDIFKIHGEELFREIESGMIKRFSGIEGLVISTGGGSLLKAENVENLKRTGVLICLTASPEEIARRTADERHRPLLDVPDRIGTVREMMAKRSRSYRQSDLTVDTDGKDAAAAAQEVLDAFRRYMAQWKR
jgi:shikimate kinase